MEITPAKIEAGRRVAAIGVRFAKRPWDGKTRPDFKGKNHPNYGKSVPIEKRKQISMGMKKAWERGEFNHITPEMKAMLMWGKNSKEGSMSQNLRYNIRTCCKNRAWRKSVLTRDNFTCQHCGHRGGELEVHHLTAFVKICIKHNISSLAEAFQCEELWELSNGLTLCAPCHNKTKGRW